MSLSCIVGMHDIIWPPHNPGSNHQQSLFHKDRHKTLDSTDPAHPDHVVAQQYANYIRSNLNTARIAGMYHCW